MKSIKIGGKAAWSVFFIPHEYNDDFLNTSYCRKEGEKIFGKIGDGTQDTFITI